jgi:ADP-ribose pyrophosphatase YjhB (NUDIX family)
MLRNTLANREKYQPGLSIDCVIFGFHDNQLKVLLIKTKYSEQWALPGGFVPGLNGIFLRQFATFGAVKRSQESFNNKVIKFYDIPLEAGKWYSSRFVTIGYYALVDFLQAIPQTEGKNEIVEWIDHNAVPDLILDHKEILDRALETLRMELNLMPVGYNLLPEKFTIPELQRLYETILGRKLDRRNFLRKITAIGILLKLDEKKSNVAHKAPNLYSFDKERYDAVLKSGLHQGW